MKKIFSHYEGYSVHRQEWIEISDDLMHRFNKSEKDIVGGISDSREVWIDKSTTDKNPFEDYLNLSHTILHAANHWKIDGHHTWQMHLNEINKVCAELTRLRTDLDNRDKRAVKKALEIVCEAEYSSISAVNVLALESTILSDLKRGI